MITIVVPIYNNARFLDFLIRQFYQQTASDFEVVFVDDGSTDNLQKIINQIDDDKLIYRYIRQNNQGVGAARNTGIDQAQGQYLMFVDPDDQIMPNFVAEGANVIKKADLGIMAFDLIDAQQNQLISHHQWKNVEYQYSDFLKNFHHYIIVNCYFLFLIRFMMPKF